jgi:hypothetical protein
MVKEIKYTTMILLFGSSDIEHAFFFMELLQHGMKSTHHPPNAIRHHQSSGVRAFEENIATAI